MLDILVIQSQTKLFLTHLAFRITDKFLYKARQYSKAKEKLFAYVL